MLLLIGVLVLKLGAAHGLAHLLAASAQTSTTATSSLTSGSTAPILVVVLALLGSGGLGYFLDRRSAQASRLAEDAVKATDVFQASLEEERTKRAELSAELAQTKIQLADALQRHVRDEARISELESKVAELSAALAEARLRGLQRT